VPFAIAPTGAAPRMTGVVEIHIGALVCLAGEDEQQYVIVQARSASAVVLENRDTFRRKTAAITELRPVPKAKDDTNDVPPELIPDEYFKDALHKQRIVREVDELGGGLEAMRNVAAKHGIHYSTIYRWKSKLAPTGRAVELVRKKRSDVGKTRLTPRQEVMIRRVIRDFYFTLERPSITAAHTELGTLCRERKLPTPSLDSLKSRLDRCSRREAAEKRGDKRAANKLRPSEGSISGANYPYSLVQIDHTRVDIFLVDGDERVSIGRPWITVAIDVFSRMCVGYYVSFDTPGMLGTGLCLHHAILNKDKWLAKLGLSFDYPCQGIPRTVHADNAKEFRGNDLKRVCDVHHMELQWRKLLRPQYGAHIERLMGTLMKEIHALPGTAFSNVEQKGEYDAEANAVMTLEAFEKWLANLIVGVYHNRPHAGLNDRTPISVYKQALSGENGRPTGSLRIETDEESLYFDMLPSNELTIQPTGVQWDYVHYKADVLNRWIGARDPMSTRRSRKFLFKRDPRDLSALFFLDPETKRYSRVPYRNLSNPSISIWELRRIRAYLRGQNRDDTDEEVIFKARAEMRSIRESEKEATREARRKGRRARYSKDVQQELRRAESPQPEFGHAAPGREEVLASQDPLAPTSEQVEQRAGAAPYLPVGTEAAPSDGAHSGAPPSQRESRQGSTQRPPAPKPPVLPFDEIEDY
jgi:putative transposase